MHQPPARPISEIVSEDPWAQLKSFTQARIALGRVGSSLPTREVLDFSLSHALARDAVHLALDTQTLIAQIQAALAVEVLHIHSQAQDRAAYLLRPDWGRQLSEASRQRLSLLPIETAIDLLLVVADGLSSLAVQNHALPLLEEIRKQAPAEWYLGPLVVASQARVALADEIGEQLGARMVAILIGERPGLSSPDSLGVYLTHQPKSGRSDAERNCISNIRPGGLDYAAAAKKLLWLAKEARRLNMSGVALKDESEVVIINK
jgi:ethanolamine ammonia-lyase small subunit